MAFNLNRWNPVHDMARLGHFKNMDSLLREFNLVPDWSNIDAEPRIRMDVTESDTSYTVKADIPGVRKEDIKVSIVGNQVTISADAVRETKEKEGDALLRRERHYGRQYRSFALSHDVDEAGSVAKYRDGVLELSLPKKSVGKERHLPID